MQLLHVFAQLRRFSCQVWIGLLLTWNNIHALTLSNLWLCTNLWIWFAAFCSSHVHASFALRPLHPAKLLPYTQDLCTRYHYHTSLIIFLASEGIVRPSFPQVDLIPFATSLRLGFIFSRAATLFFWTEDNFTQPYLKKWANPHKPSSQGWL